MPCSSQDQVRLPQQTSQDPRPSGPKLPLQLRPQQLPATTPPGITAPCQDAVPSTPAVHKPHLVPCREGSWLPFQIQFPWSRHADRIITFSPEPPNAPFSLLFALFGVGLLPRGRHHEWFISNDPELGLVSKVVDEAALNQVLR